MILIELRTVGLHKLLIFNNLLSGSLIVLSFICCSIHILLLLHLLDGNFKTLLRFCNGSRILEGVCHFGGDGVGIHLFPIFPGGFGVQIRFECAVSQFGFQLNLFFRFQLLYSELLFGIESVNQVAIYVGDKPFGKCTFINLRLLLGLFLLHFGL